MNPSTAVTSSNAVGKYIQRLDLGADPFAADFDSEYFYEGAMRRDSLDQLIHFSRFSDQTVVLTGSTGSGTSRLLDRMFDQLDQIIDYCYIDGEEGANPELILQILVEQLQLQLAPPYRIDDFIAVFLENPYIGIDSEPLLLVIDQAHFLSIESYSLLLTLLENSQRRISLLLVGEYQIEQLATLAGFSREKLKFLELCALTPVETGEFVLGLLCAVGYAGDQPLSRDQLGVLWEQSGGNIAEIIRLTPALLATEQAETTKKLQIRIPLAHAAAIVVLAIGLGLSYWYLGQDDKVKQAVANSDKNGPSMAIRKEFTDEAGNALPALSRSLEPIQNSNQQGVDSGDASAAGPIVNSGKNDEIRFPKVEVESQSIGTEKVTVDSPLDEDTVELAISDDEAPIIPPATAQNDAMKEELPAKTSGKSIVPLNPDVAVLIPPKESREEVTDLVVETFSAEDQRLLGLPVSDYMLQLTGSVDENRIKEFVKLHSRSISISYFETRLNDKPWFVAVTGPFRNRSLAVDAVKALPGELKKQNPWARSVSSIQTDIRSR